MSSSRSSASVGHARGVAGGEVVDRPSPRRRRASSASTTCEPMKPAPPVTIERCGHAGQSIASAARGRAASSCSTASTDSSIRSSTRMPARDGGSAAADGSAAEHDRDLRMLGLQRARARVDSPASSPSVAPSTTTAGDWLSTVALSRSVPRGRCRASSRSRQPRAGRASSAARARARRPRRPRAAHARA